MYKNTRFYQIVIAVLLFPVTVFGHAPDLRTAASFALFTANGALTNTGATFVTGDIGTDVGQFSGFAAGTVNGQTQLANGASAQAAADVRTAYGDLGAATCGSTLSVTLGSQTLTPGTYCTGAATTLDGVLTLDGQGDAAALFIINVGGALAIAPSASIVLTNGASVANVYWRVDGRFELGENAMFRGTVLADGAISLLAGSTFMGRALSQAGAITVQQSTVFNLAASPLPVVLTAFSAERQGADALLRWATASEHNSAYFEVQSSTDGQQFTRLARTDARGQALSSSSYAWTDPGVAHYAAAVVYYRLQQVDVDGTSTYSPVRSVLVAPAGLRFEAYPNPSQAALGVHIEAAQAAPATLFLTNALGQVLLEKQLVLAAGSNQLDLAELQQLRAGYYLLRLQCGPRQQTLTLVRH